MGSYSVSGEGRVRSPEQQLYDAIKIQAVYDQAYANGILEEEMIHDPDNGVIAARIEDGFLIETIRGQEDRVT